MVAAGGRGWAGGTAAWSARRVTVCNSACARTAVRRHTDDGRALCGVVRLTARRARRPA